MKEPCNPAKLRGFYQTAFLGLCAFSIVRIIIEIVWGDDFHIGFCFLYFLQCGFLVIGAYFGFRIGSSYAARKNTKHTTINEGWAWIICSVEMIFLAPTFIARLAENLTGMELTIWISASTLLIYCWYASGRKLAWLAGDKVGGRSTFLRALQLAYWALTSKYLRLHTREPKRPISDHP